MRRDYYTEYYSIERKHWWFKAREEILKDQLTRFIGAINAPKQSFKILNVGAATFRSSEMLSEFGTVTSIENNQECVDFVVKKLNKNVSCHSVTNLPFKDKSFDLICAFDVLEHVENDNLAMNEINRVCKSNGHIMITVPAFQTLWSQHDIINQHYRRYTLTSFLKIIPSEGLRIIRKTYFNFFLFPAIYLVRKIFGKSDIDHKSAQSDFNSYNFKYSNYILYYIFITEKWFLRVFNFIIGVSILVILKKEWPNDQPESLSAL